MQIKSNFKKNVSSDIWNLNNNILINMSRSKILIHHTPIYHKHRSTSVFLKHLRERNKESLFIFLKGFLTSNNLFPLFFYIGGVEPSGTVWCKLVQFGTVMYMYV